MKKVYSKVNLRGEDAQIALEGNKEENQENQNETHGSYRKKSRN